MVKSAAVCISRVADSIEISAVSDKLSSGVAFLPVSLTVLVDLPFKLLLEGLGSAQGPVGAGLLGPNPPQKQKNVSTAKRKSPNNKITSSITLLCCLG